MYSRALLIIITNCPPLLLPLFLTHAFQLVHIEVKKTISAAWTRLTPLYLIRQLESSSLIICTTSNNVKMNLSFPFPLFPSMLFIFVFIFFAGGILRIKSRLWPSLDRNSTIELELLSDSWPSNLPALPLCWNVMLYLVLGFIRMNVLPCFKVWRRKTLSHGLTWGSLKIFYARTGILSLGEKWTWFCYMFLVGF